MYVITADGLTVNSECFPGRHRRLRIELCGSGQRHRADTGELLQSQELDSLLNENDLTLNKMRCEVVVTYMCKMCGWLSDKEFGAQVNCHCFWTLIRVLRGHRDLRALLSELIRGPSGLQGLLEETGRRANLESRWVRISTDSQRNRPYPKMKVQLLFTHTHYSLINYLIFFEWRHCWWPKKKKK